MEESDVVASSGTMLGSNTSDQENLNKVTITVIGGSNKHRFDGCLVSVMPSGSRGFQQLLQDQTAVTTTAMKVLSEENFVEPGRAVI